MKTAGIILYLGSLIDYEIPRIRGLTNPEIQIRNKGLGVSQLSK